MRFWKGLLLYQITGPWKSLGFNDNFKKIRAEQIFIDSKNSNFKILKLKKLDQCTDGKTGEFAHWMYR